MSQREPDEVATVPDPEAARGVLPPLAISRYELGERIGKGGMGEVFHAHDASIGRDVAIKRMLDPNASQRALARFVREARIQARLDHPAIVPVHELGVDAEGFPYIVMKRLSGLTMREVLARDVSKRRLLGAFVDVCFAVEYAHSRGVIHRDLKPENIMLGDFGEVYVLDWGVAKVLGMEDIASIGIEAASDDALATKTGAVIGTPEYMAPEQSRGELVDARADVYSLGRILFELLTGSDTAAARPSDVVKDVPVELDELCARALLEDRDKRLGSVHALALGVQSYLDGDRDLERRRALAEEHLAQARSALAAADGAEPRSVAMREAGRALALDPTRTEAADLIGKLMLEPPPTVPPEVEREIAQESLVMLERTSLTPMASMCAVIGMSLMIYLVTEASWQLIIAVDVLAAMVVGLAMLGRAATHLRPVVSAGIAVCLMVLVAVFCRLYSPFVVAPAVAALAACASPFTQQHHRGSFTFVVGALMLLGVLVPYAAEAVGWISPTFSLEADGLMLRTSALRGASDGQHALGVMYFVSVVSIATWIGYVTRRSERTTRRRLHLQAWHLRQLVR